MDARTFLGLEPTDDPCKWRLPVTPGVSTPGNFLFGGCGLAAGIEAMERASGRPCIWATAQYLSYAPTGSEVEFDVALAVTGKQVSQARAVGCTNGSEIITVNAALGRRPLELAGEWAERPDVPPPDQCPLREHHGFFSGTIMDRIDERVASGRQMNELDGTPGDGRSALWAHMPDVLEPSAGGLAVLGDFVPSGIGQALGVRAGGNSLDNTLRIVQLVPTRWVLVDIRIHAVANGFGHGTAHLWAEDGTLLATASQSVIVRAWPGDVPPERFQAPR